MLVEEQEQEEEQEEEEEEVCRLQVKHCVEEDAG